MVKKICIALSAILFFLFLIAIFVRIRFPRPNYQAVKESGLPVSLVYSVIKAESNFQEDALSPVGAVGLMQLMPATAQFICDLEGIEYRVERLKEGEYNLRLGCAYLRYLFSRFSVEETVLAAYNAGEGVVSLWLKREEFSNDGRTLNVIPYEETSAYVKKIKKFRKIYIFFGDKT